MALLWRNLRYVFWINFNKPQKKLRIINRDGVHHVPTRTNAKKIRLNVHHRTPETKLFLSTAARNYRSLTLVSTRISGAPIPNIITLPSIRIFHTTSRKNVPPMLWAVLKPVGKLWAMLWGRYIRRWWARIPIEKRTQYKELFGGMKGIIGGLVGFICLAAIINYVIHLQQNPLTGRSRFISLSPDQIQTIASYEEQSHMENYKEKLLPMSDDVWKTVYNCAMRILTANKEEVEAIRHLNWKVTVVDDEEINNAFVLPNGHIFVFTGLIKNMENIDQLAIIIGHEMAHAVMGHAIEHISRGQILDFGMIVFLAALWTFVPGDGIALVTQWFYSKLMSLMLELPYSRELESEADQVGLMFAAKACYDVREAVALWALTQAKLKYSDNPEVPEFLSTHPTNESRVQKLKEYLPQALECRSKCKCTKLDVTQDPERRVKIQIEDLRRQYEEYKQLQAAKT